jgi:hypothetical protein
MAIELLYLEIWKKGKEVNGFFIFYFLLIVFEIQASPLSAKSDLPRILSFASVACVVHIHAEVEISDNA